MRVVCALYEAGGTQNGRTGSPQGTRVVPAVVVSVTPRVLGYRRVWGGGGTVKKPRKPADGRNTKLFTRYCRTIRVCAGKFTLVNSSYARIDTKYIYSADFRIRAKKKNGAQRIVNRPRVFWIRRNSFVFFFFFFTKYSRSIKYFYDILIDSNCFKPTEIYRHAIPGSENRVHKRKRSSIPLLHS